MIARVDIISGKASVASINGTEGSGSALSPLVGVLRGTVQDYKRAKSCCEWKCTYTVLKLRVKQVPYESKIAKAKAERKSARSLKNLRILSKNSAEGLGSRRERCWGYVSSMRIHPKSCRIFP